jgi:hypothetical protein
VPNAIDRLSFGVQYGRSINAFQSASQKEKESNSRKI